MSTDYAITTLEQLRAVIPEASRRKGSAPLRGVKLNFGLTGTKKRPTSVPPLHAHDTTFRTQQVDGHVGGELQY